jgi:HEAT repeat protein
VNARAKKRLSRHIENLADADQEVSARAEFNLIRYYGIRAADELRTACRHPDPVVRFRAVWALGYTKDPRAFDEILSLTDDPDERVRYDATIALGIHADERAIPHLLRLLLLHDETRPAGMAFSRIGIRALPTLKQALTSDVSDVRHIAVNVIGGFAEDFGNDECLYLLQAHTKDPDPDVRSDAKFWLTGGFAGAK